MTEIGTVPRQPDREPASKLPPVDGQLADKLLGRAQAEGVELLGRDGLLSQVTRAVLERALGEDMTHHLGYQKHHPAGRGGRPRPRRIGSPTTYRLSDTLAGVRRLRSCFSPDRLAAVLATTA